MNIFEVPWCRSVICAAKSHAPDPGAFLMDRSNAHGRWGTCPKWGLTVWCRIEQEPVEEHDI